MEVSHLTVPFTRLGSAKLPVRAAALVVAAALLSGCSAPALQEPTGETFTHDPALVAGEGDTPWFVYSTGGGAADGNIQIRRSDDGVDWEYAGEVWQEKPEWLAEAVPGVQNLWAPELYEHDGTWYLYYSASTFGSNLSVIALATNSTLDPDAADYDWVDRGLVLSSDGADFNAIDPGIVEDTDGTPWLSFGSFWSGLRMIELAWPDGMPVSEEEPLLLADRQDPPNAIEAPFILPHDGEYYLFFSRDFCCKGVDSTYNIAVGRSAEVQGPYVDADGIPLLEGGGTAVLGTDGSRIAPGGQSVSNGILAYHFYDEELDGAFRLGLTRLAWEEGWPVVR